MAIEPGTPLPWAADYADLCQRRHGDLLVIARMTAGFHDDERAVRDAAYAARACNAFPALLEALEKLINFFADYRTVPTGLEILPADEQTNEHIAAAMRLHAAMLTARQNGEDQ